METQSKPTGAVTTQAKRNAEGIGISVAVLAAWALSTWADVVVPAEVVAAVSGLIGAVAGRVRDGA